MDAPSSLMRNLARQLLMNVSRAISGRIDLSQEEVALDDIVERAVETAWPLIELRRHDLTVSLPPTGRALRVLSEELT